MTPKHFLLGAGPLLIVLGVLGLMGILGSISRFAFFHPPYWINWVHFLLGIFVLVVAWKSTPHFQRLTVLFPAVVATTIGLLGLLFGRYAAARFNIPELADPSDHTAHLVVGLCAIWAWRSGKTV
jgi:FtsH-binding integral membrane protein